MKSYVGLKSNVSNTSGITNKSFQDMKKSILKVKMDSKLSLTKSTKQFPSASYKSSLRVNSTDNVKLESNNISTNTVGTGGRTISKASMSSEVKRSKYSNTYSNKSSISTKRSNKSSVSFINVESKDDINIEVPSTNISNNNMNKSSNTYFSSNFVKVPSSMVKKISVTKKGDSFPNQTNDTSSETIKISEGPTETETQTETESSLMKTSNEINVTNKNTKPMNLITRKNPSVSNYLHGSYEENVAMIKMRKKDLLKLAQNIKENEQTNKDDLQKRQKNKKVIQRVNTQEIMESEVPFMIDPPRLFCEDGYPYRQMKPIDNTINSISSILDNHKNEINKVLKCCVEQGKQCSEILKVMLSALVEGNDCILSKLESNKSLQKETMSELEKIIEEIKDFHEKTDFSNS